MTLDWVLGPLILGTAFVLIWVPIVILSQRKTHPKALFTLFFAEMWERFSFYGMRALLTLYMTKLLFVDMGQGAADAKAFGIYGAFNALLYGAPVIGGMVADKLLGFRYTILIGGTFMALGQFTLAATIGMTIPFYVGLGLIVVGNGFFKPNISSFLGTFYEKDDARKDGAYSIFYMGINIGAFLAPLWCGYLGERVDWSYGFLAAGIGIVAGVLWFWLDMRKFADKGTPPHPELLKQPVFAGLKPWPFVLLASVLAVPVIGLLLGQNELVDAILIVAGIGILGYLIMTSVRTDDTVQGQRLLVVVVLFFFHMVFWALFEQAGGSLTLLTDRHVERFVEPGVVDSGIPASQFQSLNPLYIMLLAPVFSWMWGRLRRSGLEPRTPSKFALGLLQMALGYAVIVWGATQFADARSVVPVVFICLMYLLHTTGELSLSPVGLSVVTKLSPARTVGFVMGTWFLSIAFAHKVAGYLGQLTSVTTPELALDHAGVTRLLASDPRFADVVPESTSLESSAAAASAWRELPFEPSLADHARLGFAQDSALRAQALDAYSDVYLNWGVLVVAGSAVLLLVLSPLLKRWMHGIH